LKYQEEVNAIANCPPTSCAPAGRPAFRSVHASPLEPNDFRPPLIMKPERGFPNDEKKCGACALSLFTSKEELVAFVHSMEKRNRNIRKVLGTKIATGTLVPADGMQTTPDGRGHFDLFEAAGVDLSTRFKVVEEIPPAATPPASPVPHEP
jgi:hypothetical protein